MRPVKTEACNMVYKGSGAVHDLNCQRIELGQIASFWRPTRSELEILNDGGLIELVIYSEPIPPVSIGVTTLKEV